MPRVAESARIVRDKSVDMRAAITFVNADDEPFVVPGWVNDIDSFRRWVDSDEVPEKHKLWWIRGQLWIDMSKEQLYSHNRLRTTITTILFSIAENEELGVFFSDGVHLTNIPADISGNPDGVFVSHKAFQSGRVTQTAGQEQGFVEIAGVPDMVMEVMSDSSVKKDTQLLRDAFADAGIPEYWLLDARNEPIRFDIFRLTSKGYTAGRKQDGWIKSPVFGRSFRLTQSSYASGNPKFRLEVR